MIIQYEPGESPAERNIMKKQRFRIPKQLLPAMRKAAAAQNCPADRLVKMIAAVAGIEWDSEWTSEKRRAVEKLIAAFLKTKYEFRDRRGKRKKGYRVRGYGKESYWHLTHEGAEKRAVKMQTYCHNVQIYKIGSAPDYPETLISGNPG